MWGPSSMLDATWYAGTSRSYGLPYLRLREAQAMFGGGLWLCYVSYAGSLPALAL
jgi:hypothetical protein